MKKLFTCLMASLFIALSAQAAQYTFDPTHTYVLWHVNHLGFSNLSGKWLAEGTLTLDEEIPKDSKVNVTFNLANISTGIPKLDEHLKSRDFFEVDKFPTATFTSDKVTLTGKDTAKVQGNLTLHGITKPVTLNIKLNKKGMHPMLKKEALGFTGSTTLQRSAFGVGMYVPDVGDEVKIEIEAEAYKAE